MRITKLIIYLLSFIFLFNSCSQNFKSIDAKYAELFLNNSELFEKVSKNLSDTLSKGRLLLSIKDNRVSKIPLIDKLATLGIKEILILNKQLNNKPLILFSFLTKDSIEINYTKDPEYLYRANAGYELDSAGMHFHGLGKGWYMYIDSIVKYTNIRIVPDL